MNKETKELYEFGPFRLDVEEHTFTRTDGTENGSLPEKAFQILTVLIRNRGRLVSKRELLDEVWPDLFIEENNLEKSIHAIRLALGEKSGEQRYIETVRKHGYRFVADVRDAAPDTSVKIPDALSRTRPRWIVAATAVGVLALLAGVYFSPLTNRIFTKRPSIAVLPAKPVDPAIRNELYETGLAESMIHRLSSMRGIVVRPLAAVRQYSDIAQDPIVAGRELMADYVLDSTYQLADGKVKIGIRLIDVATGETEEPYRIEMTASDIFTVQERVAAEFGSIVVKRFGTTLSAPTIKRRTSNEEAYRLYLLAMNLVDKRNTSSAERAIELLDEAVRLDPNYARAWAGKAVAHMANHFGRRVDLGEQRQEAYNAVNRALALDESLADPHTVLCQLKINAEWDFAAAEKACRRAVELEPGSARAHQALSHYLNTRGRTSEAIAEIKTAIDIEPTSAFYQRMFGISLYYARRYSEAVTQLERAIEMGDPNSRLWLINSLAMGGKHDEAFELFMASRDDGENVEQRIGQLRAIYRSDGWRAIARHMASGTDRRGERFFWGACHNADAGNIDAAFEYLERSFQRRDIDMTFLRVEPRLDPLRSDPRFADLLQRVEGQM